MLDVTGVKLETLKQTMLTQSGAPGSGIGGLISLTIWILSKFSLDLSTILLFVLIGVGLLLCLVVTLS